MFREVAVTVSHVILPAGSERAANRIRKRSASLLKSSALFYYSPPQPFHDRNGCGIAHLPVSRAVALSGRESVWKAHQALALQRGQAANAYALIAMGCTGPKGFSNTGRC
jgi:hypothetical protein